MLNFQVADVVWALRQVMIDIMCVKSKAKPPPRRFVEIWDVVAVESKMYQVIEQRSGKKICIIC